MTWLADEFGHGFSCFVRYGGEMAPMDAIWLALVKTYVAVACHFVATCPPPPSHPVGVPVVLAMPVKQLSEMAGNSAIPIHSIVGE